MAVFHGDDVVGIAAGKVDVVQHHHHRFAALLHHAAQQLHHAGRVCHVQVVEGLVQQDVRGVLTQHHGDVGTLALATREFIQIAVCQRVELQKIQRLIHMAHVLRRHAALAVRKTAKAHQIAHRQAQRRLVVLAQDGHHLGQRVTGGGGHIQPPHCGCASRHGSQAADHRQQGTFPRTVGANDGGELLVRDLHAHRVQHRGLAVGFHHVTCFDHCLPLRISR